MLPKPPRWQDGVGDLHDHAEHLDLLETTLRRRFDRESYRRDLAAASKRYASLARGRTTDSEGRDHFEALSAFYAARLDRYGPDPAPKKRLPKACIDVPLVYPDIPEALTLRVHCMETGSFRRDRAVSMAVHADHLSRQMAPDGDTLISIAVHPDRARFFEHFIEVAGPDDHLPRMRGGFRGWARPDGSRSVDRNFENTASPWRRMADDNQAARLYHWSPRRAVDPAFVRLPPVSWVPDELPWDPDPQFRAILAATETNDLALAMDLLQTVPGTDREPDFGEVLYLAFLVGEPPRGDDLRYLARKHVALSSLRSSLEDDFEEYIELLDAELVAAGPQSSYLGLASMDRSEFAVDHFAKATPPINDWPATRLHYRQAFDVYGQPIAPQGRVFAWHPGVGHHDLGPIMRTRTKPLSR